MIDQTRHSLSVHLKALSYRLGSGKAILEWAAREVKLTELFGVWNHTAIILAPASVEHGKRQQGSRSLQARRDNTKAAVIAATIGPDPDTV